MAYSLRSNPDRKEPVKISRTRILLLGSTIISIFCAGAVLIWSFELFATWEQLPMPSTPAVQFIAADFRTVVIQAENGEAYKCDKFDDNCWEAVPQPYQSDMTNSDYSSCSPPLFRPLTRPPRTVVDRINSSLCGLDDQVYTSYVRLHDGTIWARVQSTAEVAILLVFYSLLLSWVLGFTLIFIIMALYYMSLSPLT